MWCLGKEALPSCLSRKRPARWRRERGAQVYKLVTCLNGFKFSLGWPINLAKCSYLASPIKAVSEKIK